MSERDDLTEQAYHDPTVDQLSQALREAPVRKYFSTKMQRQVEQFHAAMGQPIGLLPRALPADRIPVRVELIREEFEELQEALLGNDLVETADACVDLLYVVFGLMVECGLNAGPLFDEVQRSNMSKLDDDGKPIIAGPNDPDGTFPGRVKKGPHYSRPDLKSIINNRK